MSDSGITPNLVSSPSASALSSNQTEEGRASVMSSNAFTMKQALRTAKQRHLSSQPESANEQRFTKEIEMITKQARRKEAEFSKVKALLEQRNELLELEKIEIKETADEQKRMYESMLKALQANGDSSAYENMMKLVRELQNKQPEEVTNIRKNYEKQIMELRQKLNQGEINEQTLLAQLEKQKQHF